MKIIYLGPVRPHMIDFLRSGGDEICVAPVELLSTCHAENPGVGTNDIIAGL
jgi:hypothetical protein